MNMEYRTYHEDLGKVIDSSIDPKSSVIQVWDQFKICATDMSSQLSDDIQDYGLGIEYYEDSLYINFQIENSNNGFDFMEQAGIVIKYSDTPEVDSVTLDLWKENGFSLEEMFKEFEDNVVFNNLVLPITCDISFVSSEV
jgi:hypothetical protein